MEVRDDGMVDVLFFDTLLQYYLSIAPEELPDEVWAWKIKHLETIREMENEANR